MTNAQHDMILYVIKGTYKQYIQSFALKAWGWNFLFTCDLINCDNKTLQNQP